MGNKFGLPVHDVPTRAFDAVVAAERSRARTLILRDGTPVAAIVPIEDLDRIDPPDPGAAGRDRMLEMCGQCRHDGFVASLDAVRSETPMPALTKGSR